MLLHWAAAYFFSFSSPHISQTMTTVALQQLWGNRLIVLSGGKPFESGRYNGQGLVVN